MDLRIVDGYVDDGVWDQNTVRRLHMTIRGNQVPAFSVANDRLAVAPQPCTNCDRAASDMLLEQTRISIFSWNPDQDAERPAQSRITLQGGGTTLPHKRQWNTRNMITSCGSFT